MKLDERDEALGAVLDRSFGGAARPVPPKPASVMRRGTRRRAMMLISSLATVAVFIGAASFAGARFGQDARTGPASHDWATFVSPDLPWTMPIPPGWTSGGYRFVGNDRAMLQDVRASYISNHPVNFDGWPSLGPLPRGVTDDTVILLTDQFVGQGSPTPSGRVTFNTERDDRENAGWTIQDAKVCQQVDCVRVYVWHGPTATQEDLALAHRIAEEVRPQESPPAADVLTPQVFLEDRDDRFTLSYPAGWTVADGSLTPGLPDPKEIVSIGTFPLRPGDRASTDPDLPGYALEEVGPDDVFITVQETSEGDWAKPRPRPISFDPSVWCERPDCLDGTSQGLDPLRAWWIPFQDGGRSFYVFVAMGEEAFEDAGMVSSTWASLDSLSFGGDETGVPVFDPVRFDPAEGWEERSDPGQARFASATAWTANVPLPVDQVPRVSSPDGLVESLTPDDVFITAWQVTEERPQPGSPDFPTMELPLSLPAEVESSWEGGIEGKGRSAFWANVNGRGIQVWIFYGTPDPSEEVRAEAAAALARLQVEPLEPIAEPVDLPPPTTDEFRSEFVSDEEGYRFWPISGPVEVGVPYRFEVPHCGLDWLTDFDGSFWRPIDPNQPEPEVPSFFFNADRGTMELVAPRTAEYVSSTGRVVMLVRLDGAIVRQLCA